VTKAEYRRAYSDARRSLIRLSLEAGRKIRVEYARVFSVVARAVRGSPGRTFAEDRARSAFPRKELHDFIREIALEARAPCRRY